MKKRREDPSEVGQEFFYGISRRKSYRKAFPYLFEAANDGYIHAQNLVGYCYDLGLGVEKDKRLAAFWYEQAAKGGHREAVANLALHYEKRGC